MSTKLLPMAHLVEACGTDQEKLAGLSMLIALAAYGLGRMGARDQASLDQVNVFQRVVRELEKRTPPD